MAYPNDRHSIWGNQGCLSEDHPEVAASLSLHDAVHPGEAYISFSSLPDSAFKDRGCALQVDGMNSDS
jgi:hypothetical protein